MAGMAGVGGKLAGGNAFGLLSDKAGMFGANMGSGAAAPGVASGVTSAVPGVTTAAPSAATTAWVHDCALTALPGGGAQFTGGLGSRFGQAVRTGLPAGTPGMISRAAPMMAGMGVE